MKTFFLRIAGFVLNFALYGFFGVICAFIWLAYMDVAPLSPDASSPKLGKFLDTETTLSEIFSIEEINEGVYGLILENAETVKSENGRTVSVLPTAPIFSLNDAALEACIPFSCEFPWGGRKFGAYFTFELNGRGAELCGASIGRARLPLTMGRSLAKKLTESYSAVLQKYGAATASMKAEVSDSVLLIK